MQKRRLVIVGAGPIGIEAALRAVRDGYDVTVLERGRVGEAVRGWGHVKLFTPLRMNSSETGRSLLFRDAATGGDEILSGHEFCTRYLIPLADCEELQGSVLTGHEVVSVSRDTYGKSDRIGRPDRAEAAFRILVRTAQTELIFHADILLDCTGFTTRHRWVGAGGMPCPGERSCLSDRHYRIPDITERDRFAGRHTLVVGSGYSAATSVCLLAEWVSSEVNTHITWLTRGHREHPIKPVIHDPLPERVRLTAAANRLAAAPDNGVRWIAGAQLERISSSGDGFEVQLTWHSDSQPGRAEHIMVDDIVANPGFRPDTEPFGELQIHRCYATEGPIRLAAHLLGEVTDDCLQQTSGGPELLQNPEPDFYILGAAGYGRNSSFLLQTGLQQIDELFARMASVESATT